MGAGIVTSVAARDKNALRLFVETVASIQGDMVSVVCDPSWTVFVILLLCFHLYQLRSHWSVTQSHHRLLCDPGPTVLQLVFSASTSVAFCRFSTVWYQSTISPMSTAMEYVLPSQFAQFLFRSQHGTDISVSRHRILFRE